MQARTLAAKMLGSAHRYSGYNTARLTYEHHRAHRRKLDTSLTEKLVRNPRRKVLERMRTSKILKAVLILAEVLVDMTLVVLYCIEMGQSVEDFPQFKTLDLKPTWLWQPRARWLWEVVVSLSMFNLASLVARTYFSESPMRSLFLNPLGIVDLLTMVPAIVSMPLEHGQYLFFPYFLRSIVVIPRLRRLIHIRMEVAEVVIPADALRERMVVQIATLLCILYVIACSFQYVELVIGNKTYQVVQVLYFSVVSLTTVGYGDITPDTDLGRLVVMIGIAVAFVAIPSLVGSVLETHKARKAGGGAYHVSHTPHVVLVGRFDRAPFVASIIHAFFSNVRNRHPVRIVLFSRHSPTADVKNIINAPLYNERVHFIKGSPLNDSDLSRAQVRSALAVFVLSSNLASDDERSVLRVWSIAQYAPHVELYVFHHRPEYSRFHLGHATAVVCAEDLRQALLAVACLHPGAATLVTNLVNDAKPLEAYASPWLAQFASVCAYLFREFQVVAIAVRVPVVQVEAEGEFETVDYHVVLNPGAAYVFCGTEEIVTLAQGIRELELIQKLARTTFLIQRSPNHARMCPQPVKLRPRPRPPHCRSTTSTRTRSTLDTRPPRPTRSTPATRPSATSSPPRPTRLTPSTLHSVDDCDDLYPAFQDHTLVITSRWNLFRFLCTLRSAHIPRADLKPILFLSSSLPSPDEFRALAAFPFVYYLHADPRSPVDLNRAGLSAAERVVIMGGSSERDDGGAGIGWQTEVDDFADLDAILTRHMVTKTAARGRARRAHRVTVVELNTASSIKFLAPSYASGGSAGESSSLPASGTATPRSTSVLLRSRTQSWATTRPVTRVHQMSQQQQQQDDGHGDMVPKSAAASPERVTESKSPTSSRSMTSSSSRLSSSASGLTSDSPSSGGRQSSPPSRSQLVSSSTTSHRSTPCQLRSPPPLPSRRRTPRSSPGTELPTHQQEQDQGAQMFFDSQFASGEAFVAEMLNTILISHFFNPTVLEIVRLFSVAGLKPSSLYTEPVPVAYAGRPFKDLFIDFCLHRHVVALGLYRAPNSELGNARPFVYTGPHPDVVLYVNDMDLTASSLADCPGDGQQANVSAEGPAGGA
ncbi:hypothetical protein BCR44DRAFT_1425701 [Catenaria anguillulae PL171]|uniref:Potassium channel domain-containing protein n=1 Tax=Catenaria anguillulae PL171 TaxID=765915 RepID=A0A1Y2HYY3_9FUNG|nr:hypothetical protein BCR44DRAFT_1425701 [Catenaria anguillulae PL171]